jgi:hypothetical protein
MQFSALLYISTHSKLKYYSIPQESQVGSFSTKGETYEFEIRIIRHKTNGGETEKEAVFK